MVWSQFERSGLPAPTSAAPALVELYEAARHAQLHRKTRAPLRSFSWRGQRYPLQTTNFGRIKVLDPKTLNPDRALVVGPIGDLL